MTDFGVITTGDREVVARLATLTERVKRNLAKAIGTLLIEMQSAVRSKLNGPVLNRRSGKLQASIRQQMTVTETEVTGIIGAGKNVPYAAIHEFGGQTKPHEIRPKNKAALAFMGLPSASHWGMVEGLVFAKVVHHPGSRMPERSYLRSTLAEFAERISENLTRAVADAEGAAS